MQGVKQEFIYSGNKKVDGNPYNPLTDELKQEYKKELHMIRKLFASKVAKSRKMTTDDVMNTEAGMYTGSDAVDIGFADTVGTLKTAISDMKSFLTKSPELEAYRLVLPKVLF
jgi:ClpP class serine protease